MVELPLPRIGRPRWPWVGGFYFRLLPRLLVERYVAAARPPFLYVHPWELYDAPATPGLSAVDRFILGYGRRTAARKLDRLLAGLGGRFDFVPMRAVADRWRRALA